MYMYEVPVVHGELEVAAVDGCETMVAIIRPNGSLRAWPVVVLAFIDRCEAGG
jgi:hypothetical protein